MDPSGVNYIHFSRMPVIILLCNGHDHGLPLINVRYGNLKSGAGPGCHGNDFTAHGKSDHRSFICRNGEVSISVIMLAGMGNGQVLRYGIIKRHKGIPVMMEQPVGDLFGTCIIRPVGLLQEILAGGIPEGRHGKCGREGGCVTRHEIGEHIVEHPPDVSIIHEGIGNLGCRYQSQCTAVLAVISMAMEFLGKTFGCVMECACLAVNGENKGQFVIHIIQIINAGAIKSRFSPSGITAMVPVLQQERPIIDGIDHVGGGSTGEPTQFLRCGGDITESVRAEIINNCRSVRCR